MQQLWLLSPALAWSTCCQSGPHYVLRARQKCGRLSPIRSTFVYINSFSGIWQNRTWTERAPAAWMNNSHLYPSLLIYRASAEPDRIGTWIVLKAMHRVSHSFKYDKAMMLKWSAHWFITIYHVGMCSIWIQWSCIQRRSNFLISLFWWLNRIVQYTKLNFHVRYANKVMSPHILKKKF